MLRQYMNGLECLLNAFAQSFSAARASAYVGSGLLSFTKKFETHQASVQLTRHFETEEMSGTGPVLPVLTPALVDWESQAQGFTSRLSSRT
jgi:hypothetical protein